MKEVGDMSRLVLLMSVLMVVCGGAAVVLSGGADEIPGEGANVAFDTPAKLAWDQFIFVNAPETPGAGGSPVRWEAWASAEEVFADPNVTPQWPAEARSGGSEPDLVQRALFRRLARLQSESGDDRHLSAVPEDSPEDAAEVRYDRTAFDWIVLKQLWYLQGQQKWFDLYALDQPVDVDFPDGATLVKATWKAISEADKPRFHWRIEDGRLWGLTAMHITSKILPGWFWTTFEHAENPGYPVVAHQDPYGLDGGSPSERLIAAMKSAGLDSAVWSNYRLVGTQTEYTDRDGAPVVLGNSVIEAGFTAVSSCRTCHVRSTIGETGHRLSFEPRVGSPDPTWFVTPSRPPTPRFLRLDYAWSLARAKPRTRQPATTMESSSRDVQRTP
jgi:hypothetical protein